MLYFFSYSLLCRRAVLVANFFVYDWRKTGIIWPDIWPSVPNDLIVLFIYLPFTDFEYA